MGAEIITMLTYQCWNILWCDLLNIMVIQLTLQQLKKVMIPLPVKKKMKILKNTAQLDLPYLCPLQMVTEG